MLIDLEPSRLALARYIVSIAPRLLATGGRPEDTQFAREIATMPKECGPLTETVASCSEGRSLQDLGCSGYCRTCIARRLVYLYHTQPHTRG